MNNSKIAIIGGMGPEATAYYYTQFIKRTKVEKDQDHFQVFVDANAKIPDRTQAIVYGKESPLLKLVEGIDRLNHLSIDKAFITCLTSHYFYDDLKAVAQFKLFHAIEETANTLKSKGITKIGLLATTGTVKLGLFHQFIDGEIFIPNPKDQESLVMDAIYSPIHGIKSGHTSGIAIEQLKQAGQKLIEEGAQVIIGGCTEVSMVLSSKDFSVDFIDPMLVVIDKIIQEG